MATSRSAHRQLPYLSSPSSSRFMADNRDPRKALDVTPDAAGFTCVGFAPSKGRRCHNPIAAHNRDAACALLDIIAELSLAAENLNSLFARLAPLVLCRRNHQGQATSMVSEWQRKVVALKRRNERASVSTIRTEVAPLYPAPTEARSVTYRSSLSQAVSPFLRRVEAPQ